MQSIKIDKLWEVDGDMVQVRLQASNGSSSSTEEIYLYPHDLIEFASGLYRFPQSWEDQIILELGSKDRTTYNYVLLRAFIYDAIGHSAIEIKMDNHLKPPKYSSAHFFLSCEGTFLHELGNKLAEWAEDMTDPFSIEWPTPQLTFPEE